MRKGINEFTKLRYDEDHKNRQNHQSQTNASANNTNYNVGRNEMCPCGSDEKYKNCCLNKHSSETLDTIKFIQPEPKYNQFTRNEVQQFYMIWSRFLNFVNKFLCKNYGFKYQKIYDKNSQTKKYFINDEVLKDNYYLNFRNFLYDNCYMLVDSFIDKNRVSQQNIEILLDIRNSYKLFKFYSFEMFKNGDAIFWDASNNRCYYTSKLSFNYSDTIPAATLCEAMFFHYKGRIINDGMAAAYEAKLGKNAQKILKDDYEEDREFLKFQLEKNENPKATIYQLKISIKGANPHIWRKILVKSTVSFYVLHIIIQTIFNWENYHLYQFDGDKSYTDSHAIEEYLECDQDLKDALHYRISQELQQQKDKINYTYDFGDHWEHEIVLEKILEEDENIKYPICIAGKRNGPPEDCGGIWGYSDIINAIETKKYNEFEHLLDEDGNFYYEDLNPSYFDKDEINKNLHREKK